MAAIEEGRSPILLTEREDHLEYFAEQLRPVVRTRGANGRMTARERRDSAQQLASIQDRAERLVLAIIHIRNGNVLGSRPIPWIEGSRAPAAPHDRGTNAMARLLTAGHVP